MEFLFLAAIFLTSTGYLVGAAVAPEPPAAPAPASESTSGEAGVMMHASHAGFSGQNLILFRQTGKAMLVSATSNETSE